MANEVSPDVEYLISQLNQLNKTENELKIIYNNEQVNWQNSLTKEETKDEPIIQLNDSTLNKTLVCFSFLNKFSFIFYLKCKGND